MNPVLSFVLFCILVFAWSNTAFGENRDTHLSTDYMGQTPPQGSPVVFAPGVVSKLGRYEFGISFSPDLKEVYFSAKEPDKPTQIYYSIRKGDDWSPVTRANFTAGAKDTEMKPFVSMTENRLYFTAYDAAKRETRIWFVTRENNAWVNPQRLNSPINDDRVFYLNQGKAGDLYFTNIAKRRMFYAPNQNGTFPDIQPLPIEFGTQAFIAPSQDYLVANARYHEDENRKDNDLFVYFKHQDGSWSAPINLGTKINSEFGEAVPSITPDGKYLFFSRYDEDGGFSNFYWVSTNAIKQLKQDYFAQRE